MSLLNNAYRKNKKSHRHPFLISLAILVMTIIFFSSRLKGWQFQAGFFSFLNEVTYPFEMAWYKINSNFRDVLRTYFYLTDISKKNQLLEKKIRRLEIRHLDYKEKLYELDRLRKLLKFKNQYQKIPPVFAEVIAYNRYGHFHSFRINRGERQGIRVGMPAISHAGFIGKVLRVNHFFSDIQLLTDVNFKVLILFQRNRIRAILHGVGQQVCEIHLDRQSDVKIGDHIISFGEIGAIPKGLPIGVVTKIQYDVNNITQRITVTPFAYFTRIEELMILQEFDEQVQDIQEIAGKEWLKKSLFKR